MSLMTKNDPEAKQVVDEFDKLRSSRNNWDSHWQDVANYVVPRHKDDVFYQQRNASTGSKKRGQVFDSTAIVANQLLSSALHGMLTSPATPFFSLATGNTNLDRQEDVRLWLQDTTERMHSVLNTSNFQTEVHELYLSLTSFGTSVMRMEEDKDEIVRFHSRPIYESYISENNLKVVDVVYREFPWTIRQIEQEFGELPEEIKRGKKDIEQLDIIHCVKPRTDKDKSKQFNKKFKYVSKFVLKEDSVLLKVEGFRSFPYLVPRWSKMPGEVYGRSPAMAVLPDIQMIQEMAKTTIRGAQKAVDPPLQLPDDGFLRRLDVRPAALNFKRPGTEPAEPLVVNPRVDFGFETLNRVRAAIREGFFVPQLELGGSSRMTSIEVQQRIQEQLRFMSPLLGRLHQEFLKPLVTRLLDIMIEGKKLKTPPNALRGKTLEIKFVSQVAKAQKQSQLNELNQAISSLAPLAQAMPEIMDIFDVDSIGREVANITGLSERMLRKKRDIEGIRAQRQQVQQQALETEAANKDADTAQKLASASQS